MNTMSNEYRRILNKTFVKDMKDPLTDEEEEHINEVLDSIQQPLAYINMMQGTRREIDEDDVPVFLKCTLVKKESNGAGTNVKFTLRKNDSDVVFAIYRNGFKGTYHFSADEPYITDGDAPAADMPVAA